MFYFLFYYLQYVQFKRMAVNNFNAFGLIRRKNTLFSVFFMFLKRKKKIWKFFIWFRFFVKWASLQHYNGKSLNIKRKIHLLVEKSMKNMKKKTVSTSRAIVASLHLEHYMFKNDVPISTNIHSYESS